MLSPGKITSKEGAAITYISKLFFADSIQYFSVIRMTTALAGKVYTWARDIGNSSGIHNTNISMVVSILDDVMGRG